MEGYEIESFLGESVELGGWIVALPTTISGVDFLDTASQGRSKPHISSAGNVYKVFRDGTANDGLDVYKATDPTDSFSQVASVTINGAANILLGIATFQDGDNLHPENHC